MADDHNMAPAPAPTSIPAQPSNVPASNGHAPTAPATAPPAPRRSLWRVLWGSSATAQQSATSAQPADNTREIVETVVFVVVLVLLLKSFAAEAFVIPTGSMAETLWGYQKVVTCPTCKYQFPVNASKEADAQEGAKLETIVGCTCPNCLQEIALKAKFRFTDDLLKNIEEKMLRDTGARSLPPGLRSKLEDLTRKSYEGRESFAEELQRVFGNEQPELQQALLSLVPAHPKESQPGVVSIPDPGWTSGDRVLVSKFIYEMFGSLPNRLDVVVFKFPGDSGGGEGPWPHSGPQKNHVPINYIKRLIGLPGEMIAIKGGKLYVLPADKVRDLNLGFDDLAGFVGPEREERRRQLWRRSFEDNNHKSIDFMHVDDRKMHEAFEKGLFGIIKKPPEALLSMRRNVYDNDHQPSDQTPNRVRWPATDEWKAAGTNGFEYTPEGKDLHWLRYRHVLRGDSDKPQLIADVMGYNSNIPGQGQNGSNWVGDLSLDCEAVVDRAEGELALELSRGNDRFRAVWDLSNGRCTLYRLGTKEKEPGTKLDSAETKLGKGTSRLRFANVDRRLTVWVDNHVVEWSGGKPGVDYDVAADADVPTDNDLHPASIGAANAAVRVQKIKLWRDTYYTLDPSRPDPQNVDFFDPAKWNAASTQFKTFYVQPGHFLCLGDNSPQSSDGRHWGLVPERLLLGRAQVVYYPFYFPWWPLSSQVNRVGLIR